MSRLLAVDTRVHHANTRDGWRDKRWKEDRTEGESVCEGRDDVVQRPARWLNGWENGQALDPSEPRSRVYLVAASTLITVH